MAVWTPAGIWDSWDLEPAHEVELARLEVGDRPAAALALSRGGDCSVVGRAMYRHRPPAPEPQDLGRLF